MTSFNVTVPNNKISEFIKFLESIGANYSDSEFEEDWYESLDGKQKQEIQEGLNDIQAGRVFSHNSVMEEMAEYIKSKKK